MNILIGDYSQNLGLPHAGDEQPGDSHYFSLVNFLTLVLEDSSLSSKKLKDFICTDAYGAKCGIKVLSCALACIDKLGSPYPLPRNQDLTTEVAPPDVSAIYLELHINHDSCGRQNKNSIVLRGGLIITPLYQFRTANVLFLEKDYAKIAWDRTFNLMK